MKKKPLVPILLALAPIGVVAACYGPTSMRVEVLTDVPCGQAPHALVFTGNETDALGDTNDCKTASEAQTLGTLLFAPKDDRTATVKVRVRMSVNGKDPNLCDEATDQGRANCAFASRRFSYTEHESRSLAVRMYGACIGKSCPDGSTCVPSGATYQCVSDQVSCQGGDCGITGETTLVATPVDAGVPLPVEASVPVDASLDADAGPTCAGYSLNLTEQMFPDTVTASATNAYWVEGGQVQTLDLVGRLRGAFTPPGVNELTHLAASKTTAWSTRAGGGGSGAESVCVGTVQAASAVGSSASTAFTVNPLTDTGYLATGTSVFTVPSTGTVTPFGNQLPSSATALATNADFLYALAGNTIEYRSFASAANWSPLPGSVNNAVLLSGHSPVLYATTQADVGRLGSLTATPLVHAGAVPTALGEDTDYAYWVEPGIGGPPLIRRVLLASAAGLGTSVHVATALQDESIVAIAPDPSPTGCVYYWANSSTTGKGVIRAVAKVPGP